MVFHISSPFLSSATAHNSFYSWGTTEGRYPASFCWSRNFSPSSHTGHGIWVFDDVTWSRREPQECGDLCQKLVLYFQNPVIITEKCQPMSSRKKSLCLIMSAWMVWNSVRACYEELLTARCVTLKDPCGPPRAQRALPVRRHLVLNFDLSSRWAPSLGSWVAQVFLPDRSWCNVANEALSYSGVYGRYCAAEMTRNE